MVRCDLAGDIQARLLGRSHQLQRTRRGEVLQVEAGPGVGGQGQVSRHDDLLGNGWQPSNSVSCRNGALVEVASGGDRGFLGVIPDDGVWEVGEVGHDPAHQPGIGHRVPVIGEEPHTRAIHPIQVGHLQAPPLLGQ